MTTVTPGTQPDDAPQQGMSTAKKIGLGAVVLWLGGVIFFIAVLGFKPHKAHEVATGAFSPTDEFKLDKWVKIAGPIQLDKGVLYLFIATILTLGIMLYISKRLQQRPGRLQVAVEGFYGLCRGMAKENLDENMERKYFPLIATLFVFILVSNLIGYIPLPVDTEQHWHIGSAAIPAFQLYAADTNVAFPLMLSLAVFVAFTYEGIKHHGPVGYVKSLMPDVDKGWVKGLVYPIEILSYFLRLISLTVRLWANLLAGHLLIAFMGGELGVLTGDAWVSWLLLPAGLAIFMFEAVLIAGLQAFIFSILTAIYLGSAVTSH